MGQETGYWGAGWKMLGKRLNRGKRLLSWPDVASPMSFAPDSRQEGAAAWIELRPRNALEEEEGDLCWWWWVGRGEMGGAIFKLGETVSEFISTLSAGGGKGPIVQGSREGAGEGGGGTMAGIISEPAGEGRAREGASPSQLAY